ncbi:MAG: GIY-YIG nuclease family protein [Fibrobacterales bacterium]|nr:GIY-YIG nuclease family protein [Fibrobacterales bacterium]
MNDCGRALAYKGDGNQMEKPGYIYVLTNESFHRNNWIKIGYAEDVDKRVKELSGTAVPLPYEVYCTYEIPRIQGIKDPDKLLHALIATLNPGLRISDNREFFEMYPWDAYDILRAIAQMHGRIDKLKRNEANRAGKEVSIDAEHSVELLFPPSSPVRSLYEKLRSVVLSVDSTLEETALQNYVAYKIGKRNAVALRPMSNCIEVVLNAKLGQIKDDNGLIYDISNRKWTAEQYALKFFADTDIDAVRDVIRQTIHLKKPAKA